MGGTICDYLGFKHNYYRMVYVQRKHYMHKVLVLEQMVPEQIKKRVISRVAVYDGGFRQRLQRLKTVLAGKINKPNKL